MTVTATIFIHGRQGTFDQFDHMAASGEEAVGAFAFDWSEGRLVEWGAAGFRETGHRSSGASVGVGAAVIKAAGQLLDQIDACRLASARVVGHSKGGAVALQAIVEIIKGRHNPGTTTVTTLDPSISKRASFGVRLGAAASKWPWLHGRLSGEPRFDRLDIGEIRRFLLSKRLPAPLAAAGITLWTCAPPAGRPRSPARTTSISAAAISRRSRIPTRSKRSGARVRHQTAAPPQSTTTA